MQKIVDHVEFGTDDGPFVVIRRIGRDWKRSNDDESDLNFHFAMGCDELRFMMRSVSDNFHFLNKDFICFQWHFIALFYGVSFFLFLEMRSITPRGLSSEGTRVSIASLLSRWLCNGCKLGLRTGRSYFKMFQFDMAILNFEWSISYFVKYSGIDERVETLNFRTISGHFWTFIE